MRTKHGLLLAATLLSLLGCRPTPQPPAVQVIWIYEQADRGAIIAAPLVTSDRIYLNSIRDVSPISRGLITCLDRQTRKILWQFDDGGAMLHSFSSPCLEDGRLYFGEGMHANFDCKFYCLDARDGHKLWDVKTHGHIESNPCVANGKVYVGSGDDGLYCFDARTGKPHWRYDRGLHLDCNPLVIGNRVFIGSGLSKRYRTTAMASLNEDTGVELWQTPAELPVWGSPVALEDDLFFGLGNGRLDKSVAPPEKPAGALVCVDPKTGHERWRFPVSDGVLARPAVEKTSVFFGSREGVIYALNRQTHQLLWRFATDSPIVTSPALLGDRLYVVASGGQVCCLNTKTGDPFWIFDVAKHSKMTPQLYSAPVVIEGDQGRRLYFGAALQNPHQSAAVLYCLQD